MILKTLAKETYVHEPGLVFYLTYDFDSLYLFSPQRWSHKKRLDALHALILNCNHSQVCSVRDAIEPHFQRDFISLLPKEVSSVMNPGLQTLIF